MERVSSFKFLGVHVANNLVVHQHVSGSRKGPAEATLPKTAEEM